jgi:hypothetical protein
VTVRWGFGLELDIDETNGVVSVELDAMVTCACDSSDGNNQLSGVYVLLEVKNLVSRLPVSGRQQAALVDGER